MFSSISAIATPLPSQFASIYGYDTFQIGLIYLPMVGGTLVAVTFVGWALNWNCARHAKKLGLAVDKNEKIDLNNFPIERARLKVAIMGLISTSAVMIAWGWTLKNRTSVAVPCVLGAVLGVGYIGVNQYFQYSHLGFVSQESCVRSRGELAGEVSHGAAMSAIIQPLIDAVGTSWSHAIIGLLYVGLSPLLLLIMRKGMKWRKDIRGKEDQKAIV